MKRTMTHEIAKDARAAGAAIYAAADRLPVIRWMMVHRGGVEANVAEAEDAPKGFGEVLAVARCAAEHDVPVTLELEDVGPWGTGGAEAWCDVVLDGQPIRIKTMSCSLTGHRARWLVEEKLGHQLGGGQTDEIEVKAAELLAAIQAAGGAR